MALQSRELLIDDLKIYSDGLINALKQEKLVEARSYVSELRNLLESTSSYLESQISFEVKATEKPDAPLETTRTEAERAVFAAKRAEEKAQHLEIAAKETHEESKRLKKAAGNAKKEAGKAWKAAEKAEKSERKAEKEAKKATEQAGKANRAARRS